MIAKPEQDVKPDGAQAPAHTPSPGPRVVDPILETRALSLWYGASRALSDISIAVPPRRITAFIGPSGCGKSTLLRCFNRLNDLIEDVRVEGKILFENLDIHEPSLDVTALRKRIGMVFQKSNPFPKSVYDNVAYGCKLHG